MSDDIEFCAFCHAPATEHTQYRTGEPVALCDAAQCLEHFQRNLERERDELEEVGLLPSWR